MMTIYMENCLSLKKEVVSYKFVKKTILITGASGQLGSSLYFDLSSSFNVIPTSKSNKRKSFKLDIVNKKNVKELLNKYEPDVIINCAANTDVDFCEANHSLCRKVNTEGLYNIIKYSKKNVKIIQISSDYIFDGKRGPYSETDPTHPLNFYGKSKLEAENILIGSNKKYIILRMNGLYTSNFKFNNFLSWLYFELKNNNQLKVVNDQISNPTYIDLFSDVIMKCILMDANGIFNYGSSNFLSRYDFAFLFCKIFKFDERLIVPVTTRELGQQANRPLNTSLKTNKIESILGLKTYDTSFCLNDLKNKLNIL